MTGRSSLVGAEPCALLVSPNPMRRLSPVSVEYALPFVLLQTWTRRTLPVPGAIGRAGAGHGVIARDL